MVRRLLVLVLRGALGIVLLVVLPVRVEPTRPGLVRVVLGLVMVVPRVREGVRVLLLVVILLVLAVVRGAVPPMVQMERVWATQHGQQLWMLWLRAASAAPSSGAPAPMTAAQGSSESGHNSNRTTGTTHRSRQQGKGGDAAPGGNGVHAAAKHSPRLVTLLQTPVPPIAAATRRVVLVLVLPVVLGLVLLGVLLGLPTLLMLPQLVLATDMFWWRSRQWKLSRRLRQRLLTTRTVPLATAALVWRL